MAIKAIKEKEALKQLAIKYKSSVMTIGKRKPNFSLTVFWHSLVKLMQPPQKKIEAHEKEVKGLRAKIGELTMKREF